MSKLLVSSSGPTLALGLSVVLTLCPGSVWSVEGHELMLEAEDSSLTAAEWDKC